MNGPIAARAMPAVAAGDGPAERLACLFDAHHGRLYRLARRLIGSTDDALDLVQETFLRAAKVDGSIPVGARNEEAWLVRVLINIRRDEWRKESVRERHRRAELAPPAGGQSGDQEAALIARTTVWEALNVLPPRRRAIVILHELEGLAVPAIAGLLGVTAITVRWHLSMGRRDLTRVLKGNTGDIHGND